jgi:toxin ParE1/3/4
MPRWTTPALKDLARILEYTAAGDEEAAERIVKVFRETSSRLDQFPRIGRQGREAETRELVLPKYPFVFIYRKVELTVEILRLLHTQQKWP